jgi:hypothetical protein
MHSSIEMRTAIHPIGERWQRALAIIDLPNAAIRLPTECKQISGGRRSDLRLCIEDHWLGGNLAVIAVVFRLRTYLAVLVTSRKYLKRIDLCVFTRP